MSDEVWAKIIPPRCPTCKIGFPRLLKLSVSNEWNFDLYLECNTCLYEMHWRFTLDDISDGWVDSLMELQETRYGDSVGDFAAWEDETLVESDPEAGIQLDFPDSGWW